MGIFSKLKKTFKQERQEHIINKINETNDLGEMATLLAKEGVINVTDENHNVFGQELDHLDEEGELPFGWAAHHQDFINEIEEPFYRLLRRRAETKKSHPKERVQVLEDMLKYIKETKALCKEKGECFEHYFNVYTISDSGIIEKFEKELKEVKTHYEELEASYERMKVIEKDVLPTLKKDLLQIIKDNPDIVQKDLYKQFPKEAKPHISEILYYLAKEGVIIRTKSGNSYKLNMH